MPLDVDAVERYTKGRLPAADPETQDILNRARSAVRDFCEWHVAPPITNHVVTLDGTGEVRLPLPTGKLTTLHSVVENGIELDLDRIAATAQTKPVLLLKKSGARWAKGPSAIVVTMTHGFEEEAVPAWVMGVLDACDRFSQMVGTTNPNGLKRYDVDDIKREWFDQRVNTEGGDNPVLNERLLRPYRLTEPL